MTKTTSTTPATTVADLALDLIDPDPANPARPVDDAFAASIAQHGVLQPILVRPAEDGRYTIVAGERRYRAVITDARIDACRSKAESSPTTNDQSRPGYTEIPTVPPAGDTVGRHWSIVCQHSPRLTRLAPRDLEASRWSSPTPRGSRGWTMNRSSADPGDESAYARSDEPRRASQGTPVVESGASAC